MNACTIIARNYLAHARVLARSFFDHHAGGQFTVLLIDALEPVTKEPEDDFELLSVAEIGIPSRELHRMAMLYDVMEFATAVKPSFLKTLLARGADEVTYFDPDIEIFRPLDDIAELAREHSIVLTPHTLSPLPHDRREPGEVTLLLAGMFNLGFIAVGRKAAEFLDWWQERVARSGRVDPKRGEFVDQRWVDFVPSLFEHTVLRDPACNVAHWNLGTRRFERVDGEYRVDGKPLRFFHYSGFDPEKPYLLSKFLGPEPQILLSEEPNLARICAEYAEKLFAAGYREAKAHRYAYGTLPNGVPVTARMRLLYSEALTRAERGGGVEPPNPFGADPERFIDFLNQPAHPSAPGMTRYLADLHARRPDLREAFPDPRWVDGERFLRWAWTTGHHNEQLPVELIPAPDQPPPEHPTPVAGGVNVAGYFRAEAGVGQAARHVLNGLRHSEIPYTTMAYGETRSRQDHAFEESGGTPYDVNIICVNADELPRFTYDVGPDFFRERYSVGIWWWEVSRFPERFHDAFQTVDEVWVGSDFVREAIAAETDKPVLTLPLGIELPDAAAASAGRARPPRGVPVPVHVRLRQRLRAKEPARRRRGVPPGLSRPETGPTLVVKSINGDRLAHASWSSSALQPRDRDDIRVVDGYLAADENEAMMAACDCYVSLHRSEGFGLTIAEAMAHGKPVIATGYSGNLAFMDEETSYVVPHRLVPIPEGVEPYPAGAEWAEPDLDAAAAAMRHVFEHQEEARERGRRARERVATLLAPERTAAFLEQRLAEIRRLRAGSPHPQPSASSALERAARYLSEGPRNPIRGPSRFGPLGRLARRIVYFGLRPYTTRHAEFETAVVEALREVNDDLGAVERAGRDTVRAGSELERALARIEQAHTEFVAARHDLERQIARVHRNARDLTAELHAAPYVAEPGLFRSIDAEGREIMGYSAGVDEPAEGSVYLAFEDIFRGSEDFIRERQRTYVDVLARPRAGARHRLRTRRAPRPSPRGRDRGPRHRPRRGHGRPLSGKRARCRAGRSDRLPRAAAGPGAWHRLLVAGAGAHDVRDSPPVSHPLARKARLRRALCGGDREPTLDAGAEGVLGRPDAREADLPRSRTRSLPAPRLRVRGSLVPEREWRS